MKYLLLIFLFLINSCISRTTIRNEKYYNHLYCSDLGGKEEYELDDKTRVDCFTKDYAIEMDWAHKWYEGVTQALYYSMKTNKKAKLALIMNDQSDQKYYHRALKTIKYHHLNLEIDLVRVDIPN